MLQIKDRMDELHQEIMNDANADWRDVYLDAMKAPFRISRSGELWSVEHKQLTRAFLKDGYWTVVLKFNNKPYWRYIHTLVAQAFISKPEDKKGKLEVNHKDGNKANNNDWNLEWVTHKENIKHACDMGLRDTFKGVNSPKNIYPEETIHAICKLLEKGWNQKAIAKKLNVNKGTVNSIKQGWQWKHIAKQYKIPKPENRIPRPAGLRSKVIELLNADKSCEEILRLLGLSDSRLNRTYIRVIMNEISKTKVESSTTIKSFDATKDIPLIYDSNGVPLMWISE